MNRIQYWTLVAGSGLLVLAVVLQITLTNSLRQAQQDGATAQQKMQVGTYYDNRLRQLAWRIYQVSQQTQDQGLKDVLSRQQIIVKPPAGSSAPAPTDATAPR